MSPSPAQKKSGAGNEILRAPELTYILICCFILLRTEAPHALSGYLFELAAVLLPDY